MTRSHKKERNSAKQANCTLHLINHKAWCLIQLVGALNRDCLCCLLCFLMALSAIKLRQTGMAIQAISATALSSTPRLVGLAPRAADRKSSVLKSVVMKKCPRSTPENRSSRQCQFATANIKACSRSRTPIRANSRHVPLIRPFAHWAGVKPSSCPSISSVILGLVLFSSSSPGERIVPGK